MQNDDWQVIPTKAICNSFLASSATIIFFGLTCIAQEPSNIDQGELLSVEEWDQIDLASQRGLDWLFSQQQRNGSFPTLPHGQPGVTSLCVMAFAANGHLPGKGPYGTQLAMAIKFIASCQKPNGLLALVAPDGDEISRKVRHNIGTTAAYNHALSALCLSEVYTAIGSAQAREMEEAIELALTASLAMQKWEKPRSEDVGGWRYLNHFDEYESDLSLTGWNLMFLRSAKNAGFDVPKQPIDEAVGYVRRCFRPRFKTFSYATSDEDYLSRAMSGAGILAFAHAGIHDAPEVQLAGDWILKQSFEPYNKSERFAKIKWTNDRYHYGAFICAQAMYQLGGRYLKEFFPKVANTLVANQQPAGSWPPENYSIDKNFGNAYTTALVVLTLGVPNQLLPIFQR